MFLGNIIYDLHRFRDTYLSSLFFLKQNLIYCQNFYVIMRLGYLHDIVKKFWTMDVCFLTEDL